MNVYEFLNKLGTFYPSNESDKVFAERVNEYANNILITIRQTKCQYNFDKVFNHILQTYKFKTFPSLPDILKALSYGVIFNDNPTGREGETIKRIINGREIEFTIVSNNWENVKTISELDTELNNRKQVQG